MNLLYLNEALIIYNCSRERKKRKCRKRKRVEMEKTAGYIAFVCYGVAKMRLVFIFIFLTRGLSVLGCLCVGRVGLLLLSFLFSGGVCFFLAVAFQVLSFFLSLVFPIQFCTIGNERFNKHFRGIQVFRYHFLSYFDQNTLPLCYQKKSFTY